jgi:hypothetical protein
LLTLAVKPDVTDSVTERVLLAQGYGELCPMYFLQNFGAFILNGDASLSTTSHKQHGRSVAKSMVSVLE